MRAKIAHLALTGAVVAGVSCFAYPASAHPAIDAFTAFCFKAGQTPAQARANMADLVGDPLPFSLTFWDKTLEHAPGTPDHIERRCEVAFDGDHADKAVQMVQIKMATPPVFGMTIALTPPYQATDGTAYIAARELLRKRVAVVHIGLRDDQTFIAVDRLPSNAGFAHD